MVALAIAIVVAIPISLLWMLGIDNMNKKHPDYNGDDLFGEDKEDK